MKKWKTLSSKQLLAHPRHNVFEDEVLLPDGHTTKYLHFGSRNGAAMVLAINDKGRILVQKEYSYPPDEWLFQLPGGGIENGETPEEAAARELSEEANLAGNLTKLGWFYTENRRSKSKMHIFMARNLKSKPGIKDPGEAFEDFWFTPQEIETKIANGKIINYSLLAGWALFKSRGL